ncbi:MAG TPA: M81 family metallopeptidase [Kofleriaceae bacterium]
MKRIAFARIMQESNAFSPVATEINDFTSAHFIEGDALLRAATTGPELEGFFKRAELAGFVRACLARKAEVEPVAILSAWASSGGPLSQECFEALEEKLIAGLRKAGPLDAVYLALHGAMGAHGVKDPDERLMRAARSVIGGAPLVISHDLHANMTRERVATADAIVAYQTNPHRDHARTGHKAGEILIGTTLGEMKPTMAWRSLPILLGGGKTIDFLAPMRAVFRRMRRAEGRREVVSASTFMVHPWIDHPHVGWSTLAVANGDQAAAERIADELAEMCWERRMEQPPEFPSASEGIRQARSASVRRKLGVITMADASDVVTAGAPGDSTHLLRALRDEAGGMLVYAAVRDPQAIETLWKHEPGDRVELSIGGTLDPKLSDPLPVSGTIVSKHDQRGFLRTVVFAVAHMRIVITEGPCMVMRPSFYADIGLPIMKADIVMVKNFFPFLMFFFAYSRKAIFVKTKGTTDFDAAYALPFDGAIHPRDVVTEWRTRDAARRSGAANLDEVVDVHHEPALEEREARRRLGG